MLDANLFYIKYVLLSQSKIVKPQIIWPKNSQIAWGCFYIVYNNNDKKLKSRYF